MKKEKTEEAGKKTGNVFVKRAQGGESCAENAVKYGPAEGGVKCADVRFCVKKTRRKATERKRETVCGSKVAPRSIRP